MNEDILAEFIDMVIIELYDRIFLLIIKRKIFLKEKFYFLIECRKHSISAREQIRPILFFSCMTDLHPENLFIAFSDSLNDIIDKRYDIVILQPVINDFVLHDFSLQIDGETFIEIVFTTGHFIVKHVSRFIESLIVFTIKFKIDNQIWFFEIRIDIDLGAFETY